MMLFNNPSTIAPAIEQLRSYVRSWSADVLAVLTAMRHDDGVAWGTGFGVLLIKIEIPMANIYKRSLKDLNDSEQCQLFIDYTKLFEEHRATLHDMECYARTM